MTKPRLVGPVVGEGQLNAAAHSLAHDLHAQSAAAAIIDGVAVSAYPTTMRVPLLRAPQGPSASPTTSGGSGHSSVSQMARSSSASRTVTCWFARMQAVQATTIRRLMAETD